MELVTIVIIRDLYFTFDPDHFLSVKTYYIETKDCDKEILSLIKNDIFSVELYNLELTQQNNRHIPVSKELQEHFKQRDPIDKLVQLLLYRIDTDKITCYLNKLPEDKITGTLVIEETKYDNDHDMSQYLFNK
jgi:hypothetical protein